MDEKHTYRANVCAVIKKSPEGKFFGDVFRVEFVGWRGVEKTVESQGDLKLESDYWILSDPMGAHIEIDGKPFGDAPQHIINDTLDENVIVTIRATPAPSDRPRLGWKPDETFCDVVSLPMSRSPAEKLGMRSGDRVIGVNEISLPKVETKDACKAWNEAYQQAIARSGFGAEVTLKVLREGSVRELKGRLPAQPEGVFYIQEKHIRPAALDGQVLFFDLRTPTDKPVRLGQPKD